MNLAVVEKLEIFLIASKRKYFLTVAFLSLVLLLGMLFPFSNAYGDGRVDPVLPDTDTRMDCRQDGKRMLTKNVSDSCESAEERKATRQPFSFSDVFERDNSNQIGGKWLDCHTMSPSAFEPLGIYDGGVVVPDPFTRPGEYHLPPLSPYSLESGNIFQGIGCASIETGTTTVAVSVSGSGNLGYGKAPPISHVEGTPLLYVTPQNPRYGFGAWITELYGHAVILAGYIGNPPERFEVIATAQLNDGCITGTPRVLELRAEEPGKVTVWVDGTQIEFSSGIGLAPLIVDPTMTHSTRHGFAVDAHLVDPPTNTKILKSIEAITIRELGRR